MQSRVSVLVFGFVTPLGLLRQPCLHDLVFLWQHDLPGENVRLLAAVRHQLLHYKYGQSLTHNVLTSKSCCDFS